MSAPGSLLWFARHELRLAWRDWLSMMSAGKQRRERLALFIVLVFVAGLHLLAYGIIGPAFHHGVVADKATLVLLSGVIVLSFAMMLSQAIESVTRAFYARSDLELILSSPVQSRRLFAVRMLAIAISTGLMTGALATPFIVVAVWLGGAKWLTAFLVLAAVSAVATSLATLVTLVLFRLCGAKRTRLIAQIVAAIVGAAFLIGTQLVAILSLGQVSRISVFQSAAVIANAPDIASWVWLPARAAMGQAQPAAAVVVLAAALLAVVIGALAGRFAHLAQAAASVGEGRTGLTQRRRAFRSLSQRDALMSKEWALLARDPWLVSQTLMQVLYLIPPAVMMWQSWGADAEASAVMAPVLVMAVGQLAGGLAWLAISGEDAPDLVASAPITMRAATNAKVQAILLVITVVVSPFLLALAFTSLDAMVLTAIGVGIAAASSITIQLWFRTPMKRSQFRRRQTASKVATFSEAFTTILWAGATGLAIAGSWLCLALGSLALAVLLIASLLSPRGVEAAAGLPARTMRPHEAASVAG